MTNEIWTIGRILQWTEQYFQEKGIASARLDGEVLLSHMLNKERIYCYSHYDQPLTKDELAEYKKLILERINGRSVAAIIGKKEFMALSFIVDDNVLIPRADTETLVEGALKLYDRDGKHRILDICLGSGAILFSLLHYMPQAIGVGIEISSKAIAIARLNQASLNLEHRSEIIESNLFSNLKESLYYQENPYFDLITSNPPYIPSKDIENLAADVKNEPHVALDGGITGLDFYRPIICDGANYLRSKGYMLLEIGMGQDEDVLAIANTSGMYDEFHTLKDLSGIVRTIILRKK